MNQAHQTITATQQTFNVSFVFRQIKIVNPASAPIYLNLTGAIPTQESHEFVVSPRTESWFSPPLGGGQTLSIYQPSLDPLLRAEITFYSEVIETPSSVVRTSTVHELCPGYPVTAGAVESLTLPDIPVVSHLPITFFINTACLQNSVASVLSLASVSQTIPDAKSEYVPVYACGRYGVYSHLPGFHDEIFNVDTALLLKPRLHTKWSTSSGMVVPHRISVYAYYTQRDFTYYPPFQMMPDRNGINITTAGGGKLFYFGLSAGVYQTYVVLQCVVPGTSPSFAMTLALLDLDSGDILGDETIASPILALNTSQAITAPAAGTRHALGIFDATIPRPCFGRLGAQIIGANASYMVQPTIRKRE